MCTFLLKNAAFGYIGLDHCAICNRSIDVGSWIWCRHWIAISQTVFKDPVFIIMSMTFDVSEQCNHFYLLQFLQWGSYQICKIAGCACAGNAGNVLATRPLQMKPLISDPDMHHDTCVTHMPWCMSGSLTCGGGGNIPGACAPAILRIWQEAHGTAMRQWPQLSRRENIYEYSHQCLLSYTHILRFDVWCMLSIVSSSSRIQTIMNAWILLASVTTLIVTLFLPSVQSGKWNKKLSSKQRIMCQIGAGFLFMVRQGLSEWGQSLHI